MANLMGFGPNNAINLWPSELDGSEINKTSLLAEFKQDGVQAIKLMGEIKDKPDLQTKQFVGWKILFVLCYTT
jgi:hypothetical protein